MTLRLVLVSLVAALGLTIPGAPMIESWVASTQNWMNARFADWDTRNPQNADYVIVSDFYDMERLAAARHDRPRNDTAPEARGTEPGDDRRRSPCRPSRSPPPQPPAGAVVPHALSSAQPPASRRSRPSAATFPASSSPTT